MAVNNFNQNAAGFVPTTQIILYFRGIPLCLPADHSLTAYLLDVSVHWHLSAVSNTHSLLCITAQSVTPALALALDTLVFVARPCLAYVADAVGDVSCMCHRQCAPQGTPAYVRREGERSESATRTSASLRRLFASARVLMMTS